MNKGYWIVRANVNNQEEYLKYKKQREALRKKDKNIEILTNKVEKLENIVNELARKIKN